MNPREQCGQHFACSAPLCPHDEYWEKRVYMPDDEVCTSRIATRHPAYKAIRARINEVNR